MLAQPRRFRPTWEVHVASSARGYVGLFSHVDALARFLHGRARFILPWSGADMRDKPLRKTPLKHLNAL